MWNHRYSFSILIIYFSSYYVSKTSGDVKIWKQSIRYDNSINWVNGKTPCESSTVVLPEEMEIDIIFPSGENKMSKLILPRTGIVTFDIKGQSALNFPENFNIWKKSTHTCDGNEREFKTLKRQPWLDPESWTSEEYKDNTAMPDFERVPCQYDSVRAVDESEPIFPNMNGMDTILLNKLLIDGGMNYFEDVGISVDWKCAQKSGCVCRSSNWPSLDQLEIALCEYAEKHCKPTHCVTPIRAYGHCCDICGSEITLTYNEKFSMADFRKYISKFLKEKDFENIDFYISKISYSKIVIVFRHRDEYSGDSDLAMNQLSELINSDPNLGLQKDSMHLAGQYYNPDGGFSGITVFILSLLFAIMIIGIAYVVTQKSHRYPLNPLNVRLPSLATFRYPNFNVQSFWPFSSYTELQSTNNENMEFVQTAANQDNVETNADQEFENPLYDETENVGDNTIDTEVESYEIDNDTSIDTSDTAAGDKVTADAKDDDMMTATDSLDTRAENASFSVDDSLLAVSLESDVQIIDPDSTTDTATATDESSLK